MTSSSETAPIFDRENPVSPLSVPAAQTALLLMDYHNLIVQSVGDNGPATVAVAKSMREWAHANGVLVIHCLIDIQRSPSPVAKSAARVKGLYTRIAAQPSLGHEHEDIAFNNAPDEHLVFRPPAISCALKSDGIGELLREKGIKSLILCGLATSGVVLSTSRASADEQYIVSVISDACTDRSPEVSEMLFKHMLPNHAHVATAAEFQEHWRR